LELTDDMAVPSAPPRQPAFHKVEPQDDLEFAESAASRAINRASFEPSPPPPPAQPILSQSTVSAVESAFNTLAHTVLSHNARTLEDLVREMLRPMLKSWLDDNLPEPGGTHRQGGDRAGVAGPVVPSATGSVRRDSQ